MRVHVDPAGRYDLAGRVDLFGALADLAADFGDQTAIDSDVAEEARLAAAVDNRAAANNQIMHGRLPMARLFEGRLAGIRRSESGEARQLTQRP